MLPPGAHVAFHSGLPASYRLSESQCPSLSPQRALSCELGGARLQRARFPLLASLLGPGQAPTAALATSRAPGVCFPSSPVVCFSNQSREHILWTPFFLPAHSCSVLCSQAGFALLRPSQQVALLCSCGSPLQTLPRCCALLHCFPNLPPLSSIIKYYSASGDLFRVLFSSDTHIICR